MQSAAPRPTAHSPITASRIPSLACDFFRITACKGPGTGESFFQYPIKKGDSIIADRGYSTAAGIHHVASRGARVMVRVNTQALPILDAGGGAFNLLENVKSINTACESRSWPVLIPHGKEKPVAGRICVMRKTETATALAREKILKEASKKHTKTLPATLEYTAYVILFTTFPEDSFTNAEVLDWYRCRWQVELLFKRFKSIAELGHLPKHEEESAKAWLYGKLFTALLTEKLIRHAESVSPWGG